MNTFEMDEFIDHIHELIVYEIISVVLEGVMGVLFN